MKDISFQLYSARHTPLAEALQIVADSGYRSVEAYRDNVADLALFQSLLDANNLTCSSIHIGRDELKNNFSSALDMALQLGVKQVVCPYLLPEDRPADTAAWEALADELAGYAAELHTHNLPFAWHNHDFEFEKTPEGSLPMRILLDRAPQLQWEIDLGWIQRAGESPDSWLRTYSDRVSSVHLKDVAATGECVDEDGWADVGHGVVDWASVTTELQRLETDLFIVEHDNPSDVKRFAERSIATVNSWTLA
jgi:sugar phosphate isomerase/epimerase